MAGRNYDRLPILEFGRHLLDSNDLDPVYVALRATGWDAETVCRFLVAYWCWYDCGVASYMTGQTDEEFWRAMLVAAANEEAAPHGGRWTRGKERRHARGQQGITMVERLAEAYPEPIRFVAACCPPRDEEGDSTTCKAIMGRVKKHYLFGDWIAFKIADMAERVLRTNVSFEQAEVFMFKDPVESALLLWRTRTGQPEGAKPKNRSETIRGVVAWLVEQFADRTAPPLGDRPVGLQEVETILCKWKSHQHGHYPLNNDIDEINEGLDPWLAHSDHAGEFAEAMPRRMA